MAEPLPLVRERSVEQSGQVPGYQDVRYSADAFGAGIGRALEQLGASGQDLARSIRAREQERKALDATQLSQWAKDDLRRATYDPQNGMLARKGSAAAGVAQQSVTVTDEIKKRYLEANPDPEVQEAFSQIWAREAETNRDLLARHEFGEHENFQKEVQLGALTSAVASAYDGYNDPATVDKAIEDVRRAVRVSMMGQPDNLVAIRAAEGVSKVHLAVLSRLATEDVYKANEYYKAHKDDITGADHVTATQFIQPVLDQQRAEEWVSSRVLQGGQTTHNLWDAVEWSESRHRNDVVSPDGAIGIMQLMPDTARYVARKLGYTDISRLTDEGIKAALGADTPQSRQMNRELGRAYLQEQLIKFNGDIEAALVAYNAGPGRAEVFLNHNAGRPPGQRDYNIKGYEFLERETKPYVSEIMGNYQGGFGAPQGSRMTRENWNLKHFQPEDIMAPTEAGQWVDARAAQGLDRLADAFYAQFPNAKIKINEPHGPPGTTTAGRRRGTSDPKDNPHVENSNHLKGTAFDVQIQDMNDVEKAAFLSLARQMGFGGIGFYGPKGHLHIDMGNERSWGRQPAWAKSAMAVPVGKVPGGGPATQSAGFGGPGGTGTAPGGAGSYYTGVQPPALTAWLAEANLIADPSQRSRVMALLQVESARIEGQQKSHQAGLKQAAWEMTVAGQVKDIPPHLVMQLGHEFMNSLYSFEAARSRGGPETDWKTWSNLSTMDPAELKNVDPYEYRPVLADEEFKQLNNLVRAAQAEGRKELSEREKEVLANQRTYSQIVSDTTAALGWDKRGQEETKANFTRKLDAQIQQEQRATGKALTAPEIQNIIDRLLLTDKDGENFFGLMGKQGRALDVEDPDTFTAVETWQEVQPQDQELLLGFFRENFGMDPNQEQAVDVYNRAFRVWLGGKPQLNEDEEVYLRTIVENAARRKLNDKEFEHASRKWLLTYLGR